MEFTGCQAQGHANHDTWNAVITLAVLFDGHLEGESLPVVNRTTEATEIIRLVFTA